MSSRQDRAERALQRAADRYARARERVDLAKAVVVRRRAEARCAWSELSRAKVRAAYERD